MKRSQIQLLQTSLLKLAIEPIPNSKFNGRRPSNPFEYEKIVLETSKSCKRYPQHWNDIQQPVEGLAEKTYFVQLGLRTPPDTEDVGPYKFEVVYAAVIAILPQRVNGELSDDDLALQYGLTLLYGVIREHVSTLTYKMNWGQAMLPTMTFMDEKTPSTVPSKAETAAIGSSNN